MIYFTSDLHLGHKNVLKLCNRPFGSIEEMDACLIENWNSRVTNNDTVYILGDLMFRNSVPPEEYLLKLKGKKHLIRGNHDRDWMKKVDIDKYFVSNENLSFRLFFMICVNTENGIKYRMVIGRESRKTVYRP